MFYDRLIATPAAPFLIQNRAKFLPNICAKSSIYHRHLPFVSVHKDHAIIPLGFRSLEITPPNPCIPLDAARCDPCRVPLPSLQLEAILTCCLATGALATVMVVDARVNDCSGVLENAALRSCSVSQWQRYFLKSIAPATPFDFFCACGFWALALTALVVLQKANSLHGIAILG